MYARALISGDEPGMYTTNDHVSNNLGWSRSDNQKLVCRIGIESIGSESNQSTHGLHSGDRHYVPVSVSVPEAVIVNFEDYLK